MQVTTQPVLTPITLKVGNNNVPAFIGSSLGYTVTPKRDTQGNPFNLICLCGGTICNDPKNKDKAYPPKEWTAYCGDFKGILNTYWTGPRGKEVKERKPPKEKMEVSLGGEKKLVEVSLWGKDKPVRVLTYSQLFTPDANQRDELKKAALDTLEHAHIPSAIVGDQMNYLVGVAFSWYSKCIYFFKEPALTAGPLLYLGMDPMKEMNPIKAVIDAMINEINKAAYDFARQGVKVKNQF